MVPRIKPVQFEKFPAFRETFLVHFTMPGDAEAFRTIGRLIDVMANEYRCYWPEGDSAPGRYLGSAYPFAAEIAELVGEVADRLERGLRNRRRF